MWLKKTSQNRLYRQVSAVVDLQEKCKDLSNAEILVASRALQENTEELSEEQVVVKAFALVREVTHRVLGLQHYPTQILAGLTLVFGRVAEVATGEGKTLIGALPAYYWALKGQGVHIATANAYLAERDGSMLRPVFAKLGMSVGILREQDNEQKKKKAYRCDLTYGVGHEFGFDYLRDQVKRLQQPSLPLGGKFLATLSGKQPVQPNTVQPSLAFVLIDEVDSVLIDDARSPLVLSAASSSLEDEIPYRLADELAQHLEAEKDFLLQNLQIKLTAEGQQKVQQVGQVRSLILKYPWSFYVEQALRAHHLFTRDVDYIIDEEEKIVIVDPNTGRPFPDRSWQKGLHRAVEAKENVPIQPENNSIARITRQRFFSLYENIAGMTGTTHNAQKEFWEFYSLPVSRIPLRLPSQRTFLPTRVFASKQSKWQAVLKQVLETHQTGQPILIGTCSIEASEILAELLSQQGLEFALLNAKNNKEEAQIVAQAGEEGRITIATNMAGRGTDIKLGSGVPQEKGLFVLATEKHESARVDWQLVGRGARQGDPGVAQFFLSLEDDLLALHAPKLAKKLQGIATDSDGQLLKDVSDVFERVQKKVEKQHFQDRKKLFEYDNWLEGVIAAI